MTDVGHKVHVWRVYALVVGSGLTSTFIGGAGIGLFRDPNDVSTMRSITIWAACMFVVVFVACLRLMRARAIAGKK